MYNEDSKPEYLELLKQALNEPGKVSAAFSVLHRFSPTNILLAMQQCMEYGVEVGPIATADKWKSLGMRVTNEHYRKHAIWLWQPNPMDVKDKSDPTGATTKRIMRFKFKPLWYVLSQCEGKTEIIEDDPPGFDMEQAMKKLSIEQVPFDYPRFVSKPNTQGYAVGNTFAISKIAEAPFATGMHETAHIVLGHTFKDKEQWEIVDGVTRERTLQEVEAESVAYLTLAILGVTEHQQEMRGYIQHYLQGSPIPDDSVKRIFAAVDKILKAGAMVAQSAAA